MGVEPDGRAKGASTPQVGAQTNKHNVVHDAGWDSNSEWEASEQRNMITAEPYFPTRGFRSLLLPSAPFRRGPSNPANVLG